MKLFWVVGLATSGAMASAATIIDTFGPGDSYDSSGWTVDSWQTVAMPFSLGTATTITAMRLALFGGTYDLSICQGGAVTPGAVEDSWFSVVSVFGIVDVFPSSLNLAAGDYYLVAESTVPGTAWFKNNQGIMGDFSYTSGSTWYSAYSELSAYRIEGEPVPEPVSLAVLGVGFVALLRRRR